MIDAIVSIVQSLPGSTATLGRDFLSVNAIPSEESGRNLMSVLNCLPSFAGVIYTPVTTPWLALAMMALTGLMFWRPLRAELKRERLENA
jgi:hypothetical protein